jgi:DNA sulfur modification protein DndC
MLPLLRLRNELDFRMNGQGEGQEEEASDRHLRDFRRMNGSVQLFHGRPIPGPYTQESRERWLRKLLEAQTWIRQNGPQDVKKLELITLEELQEIRRFWVIEKHEIEDTLPKIYRETTGEPYPGRRLDDDLVLRPDDLALLRKVCGDDHLHFELARELLSIERQQRTGAKRSGHYERIEKAFSKHYYSNASDAVESAHRKESARAGAAAGHLPAIEPNANPLRIDATDGASDTEQTF